MTDLEKARQYLLAHRNNMLEQVRAIDKILNGMVFVAAPVPYQKPAEMASSSIKIVAFLRSHPGPHSIEEIANGTDIPIGAVRAALFRMKGKSISTPKRGVYEFKFLQAE